MHSEEQSFLPHSLPKLHAIQSTVTIFHGIITVSQYQQTVKMLNYDFISKKLDKQGRAKIWQIKLARPNVPLSSGKLNSFEL